MDQGRQMAGRRKGVIGALGVMGVLTLLAGAAWACVPQPRITLSPSSGEVGTTVTVKGSTFDASPSSSPVKIWWGGAGKQLVAEVGVKADRTFTATFAVPQAGAGNHVVAATQQVEGGRTPNPANAVFKVVGAEPQPAPVNAQGQRSDANGAEALQTAPADEPAPAVQPAPATQPAPAQATRTAPSRTRTATAARSTAARSTASSPAPAAAPESAPTPAAAPEPAPAPAAAPEPAPAPAPAPAEAFEPAPAPAPATAPSSGGTSAWVLVPLALLAFGLFAVGTGIFLTERKRARAEAR